MQTVQIIRKIVLTFGTGCCNIHLFAEMAELADAHGSGPCGSDTMRVQVPLSASLFQVTYSNLKKVLTFLIKYCNIHLFAEMAELADAHGSGPCGSDTMRVQVPLSASYGGDRKVAAFVVIQREIKRGESFRYEYCG